MGFLEEAKGAEKNAAEPPETKVGEAPEKEGTKVAQSRKTRPAGGNQGAVESSSTSLSTHSSRTGALGVSGLSGRAHQRNKR